MKMKSLTPLTFFIAVICFGGLMFPACSNDNDDEYTIRIEQPEFTFDALDEDKVFISTRVITDGDWDIQGGHEDWILPSKSENKFIIVGVKNNTANAREGKITLTSGKSKATLTVKQYGVNPED